MSWEKSKEKFTRFQRSIEYSYIRDQRATIDFSKARITANEDFRQEIDIALNEETNDRKIVKLREISAKYGNFYAQRIHFGGAVINKIVNSESSSEDRGKRTIKGGFGTDINVHTIETEAYLNITHEANNQTRSRNKNMDSKTRVVGGDPTKYFEDGIVSWKKSLNDGSKWEVIGYDKIYPIFEVLDNERRNKIIKVLDQRILKAKRVDITMKLEAMDPYVYQMEKELAGISNINECQIFASIMSENNEDKKVYAVHVIYTSSSPAIVVHLVQRKEKTTMSRKVGEPARNIFKKILKKPSCSITLGWIIVGPPTSFDFDLFPAVLKSRNCSISRQNDRYVAITPEHQHCILGTCVLKLAEENNPMESKIVVGSHFTGKNSACLFVYDLENREKPVNDETIYQGLTLNYCTVETSSPENCNANRIRVDWSKNWIRFDRSKNQSTICYSTKIDNFSIITSCQGLILMNRLFDNCSANCQHGFLNANSKGYIYGSVNPQPPIDNEGMITYFLIDLNEFNRIRYNY
ncbi:hsp70 family protein [Gigaspora margarita]|uniref:Hsp70 family protein n=1 Tax=Gigaspora margarita TaxID=4874 RepID=A0A8H4EGY0_GIGMA|nr:hsp70 family protein [Gigaspora margarita]